MALFPSRLSTFAQRGAAGNAGKRIIITDSVVTDWVDDGVLWHPVIQAVYGTQVPAAANWSRFSGTSTLVDSAGTLLITPSTGDELWRYTGSLNTNFTIIAASSQNFRPGSSDGPGFGLFLRNANVTGGNVGYVRFANYPASSFAYNMQVQAFTGTGTPGGASTVYYTQQGPVQQMSAYWQQLQWNNGTGTYTYSISNNGADWIVIDTRAPFEASPNMQFGVLPMAAASGESLHRLLSLSIG